MMKNNQKIFHITWVTYGSRISERMIRYKARASTSVFLELNSRKLIYKYLIEKINKEKYLSLSLNILDDHVHLLLRCNTIELSNIIRNLKGYRSYKFNTNSSITLSNNGRQNRLWAKGYSYTYINSNKQIISTMNYINTNHIKHNIPNIIDQ